MSATIAFKPKLLGKNVGIVVTPFTKDATGNTQMQTAFTVTGRAGKASISRKQEVERVDSDDADGADRDWTKRDWSLNLEAVRFTTADLDLDDLFDAYNYFAVTVTRPKGNQVKSETYYGVAEGSEWDKEIGRNVDRLSLSRMQIYDNAGNELANPQVVTA